MAKVQTIAIIAIGFASAAVVNCVAAATVLVADTTQPNITVAMQVWDSSRLLALCLIGATCGTIAKMAWDPLPSSIPEPKGVARLFACKAIVSMTCGLVVTPMTLRYMAWYPEADLLVALSALVAFVGDIVVIPAVIRVIQFQAREQEKRFLANDDKPGKG